MHDAFPSLQLFTNRLRDADELAKVAFDLH